MSDYVRFLFCLGEDPAAIGKSYKRLLTGEYCSEYIALSPQPRVYFSLASAGRNKARDFLDWMLYNQMDWLYCYHYVKIVSKKGNPEVVTIS